MAAFAPPTPPNPAPPAPSADTAAAAAAPRGRASWSGLLQLSLVAVPVKAYPATASSHVVHFNQLHADCGQRIRYEKHCPVHGKVETGAIASGYPYAPDRYVVVEEAELEKLRPAQDRALCLERFLDPSQVDPALFAGRSLYLLPDGLAAQHPYTVLAQALQQRQKWALGRLVLSGHRHLALVRPAQRLLTLHLLHYPAQLRSAAGLETELHGGAATEAELQLAGLLLDAASQPIPWAEYRDDTAEQLRALVEASLQHRPPEAPTVEAEQPVLQLLDALKQSVAQALEKQHASVAAPAAPKGRKRAPRRSA
jgi:DNA end-binding protein Ku